MKNALFLAALILWSVVALDIGPPAESDEDGYCSDGNCLYDDDDEFDSELKKLLADEDLNNEGDELSKDDENIENTHDEVAKRHPSYLDKIRNPFRLIWTATKQAADSVYNATADALEDIADVVRMVVNEEAYNMFVSAIGTFQSNVVTTDKLFGYAVPKFTKTVLSVTILLLVIVLNYIFSGTFSLLLLLVFDCSLLLLHGLVGPNPIAEFIIDFFIYAFTFLSWAISHPYGFAITVVVLFLFHCVVKCTWPYIRRTFCARSFRTDSDIIRDLEDRIGHLEETINTIDQRTRNMKELLKDIHTQVIARTNHDE